MISSRLLAIFAFTMIFSSSAFAWIECNDNGGVGGTCSGVCETITWGDATTSRRCEGTLASAISRPADGNANVIGTGSRARKNLQTKIKR